MLKVNDFPGNAMKALAAEEAAGFGDVLDLEALNHSFREVSAAERLAELSDKMNLIGPCLMACRCAHVTTIEGHRAIMPGAVMKMI